MIHVVVDWEQVPCWPGDAVELYDSRPPFSGLALVAISPNESTHSLDGLAERDSFYQLDNGGLSLVQYDMIDGGTELECPRPEGAGILTSKHNGGLGEAGPNGLADGFYQGPLVQKHVSDAYYLGVWSQAVYDGLYTQALDLEVSKSVGAR